MSWNLNLEYSWWLVIVCLLVGAIFSGLLYFKLKENSLLKEHRIAKVLLPTIRFVLVSMLCFFLLTPLLKYVGYQTAKPIVAVVVDNSKSMVAQQESEFGDELKWSIQELTTKLQEKFDVRLIKSSKASGSTTLNDIEFKGSQTNIASSISFVKNNFVNENLVSMVLVSDGIYNAGLNPIYEIEKVKLPIHTVGVGDTTEYADFKVNNVQHNSIAYLGNQFPIRIEIMASQLFGRQGNVSVLLNGKVVDQKSISIDKASYFVELEYLLSAGKLGQNRVDVVLSKFTEEQNIVNNKQSFYVEVIDSKKLVEIWADAPHPDLGVLKSVIKSNENYSAEVKLKSFTVNEDLNVVVLHNWFQNQEQLNLFETLRSKGIATLIVVGSDFKSRYFNSSSLAIKFNASGSSKNSTLPLVNKDFEYFDIGEDLTQEIQKWPPLSSPFGKFSGFKPGDVVLNQKIGNVKTSEPLILLTTDGSNKRVGIVSGTGIWQWKLQDYARTESHAGINDLVTKLVQYLSVKEDKKLLRVASVLKEYDLGEKVIIQGELYNQSLNAIANQEISIELKDEEGKTYKHLMNGSGKHYRLTLKSLNPGMYQFVASAKVGGELLRDNGYFAISESELELKNLTANLGMLKEISRGTGGTSYNLGGINELTESLLNNPNYKSSISEEHKLEELINFRWIFWILISLLSLEWFVRKWVGSY
jgi:hypothetical protein